MADQDIGVSLFQIYLNLYSVVWILGVMFKRGILNPEFLNRLIHEPNTESLNVHGSVECVIMCSLKINYVSVQHNNMTKKCVFYDDYFTM